MVGRGEVLRRQLRTGAVILALVIAGVVVLAAGIIWLNVSYRDMRAQMTPEEREAYDEELTNDIRMW